jgi:pimeloyl-ACP methyl ester carboxylesterase
MRMNTVRRRAAVVLVALLGAGGSLATTAPAVAAPAPGTVLSATTAVLPTELVDLATGKRIQYVSTDVNGATITATGLILTPKKGKNNKTVAWGHGTTGLADQCAPSISQAVFWPEGRAAIAGLLKQGWTVAATDYPGLGTPQPHPYLIGASEARAVIDSVKAARNLDGGLSTQYVVDGYSQGGQAALFTGELAPTYDGALVLRGVVAIAPVSNVDALAPVIPDTPNRGYLVMGLAGLATVDPSVNPVALLAPPARLRLPVLLTGCLNEILAAYEPLNDRNDFLAGGTLPQTVVDKLARWDNPAQSPPSARILLVQGTADEAVPDFVTRDLLVPELTAYPGAQVEYQEYVGADHEGAVIQSVDFVNRWIAARFN